MLTYSFADIGSDALYEHLYKCLKADIISRKIKPGEKLPSKRSFAKNLGISVITIENAYEQLMSEGYIYSIAKKGFFVADISSVSSKKQILVDRENLSMTSDEERYLADFSSNRISNKQFPFTVWAKLLRECLLDYQEELLVKPPSGGALVLRKAIAKHLHDFRNMNVDPEQIIIGAGTEYLYGQIVQLFGQDKVYGVEDPGFPKTAQVYQVNGAKVKYISLDEEGICVEELIKEKVQVAHTSPSHQFPTGRITPISRRYELLGWASKREERYIIEDDYDSEFRMVGKPIPTLQSIDVNEKVIYLNTFSKSISNTVRISYMVLPKHLVDLYYKKLYFYSCPVPSIVQLTVAKFIGEGYFEKHINRLRTFYRKQRDILLQEIQDSKMSSLVKIREADAGLHFLLALSISCTDDEFVGAMERQGIRLRAVSEYYQNRESMSTHTFVINYSSLTEEQIKVAVQIMSKEVLLHTKKSIPKKSKK
ncbi:MAG: PLP-dependent aminotransferase family protein [Lachnospiraceae bacterium]|nr:PLP-dependent aminotransferase family protein [Lachnospiraceae bacterium]